MVRSRPDDHTRVPVISIPAGLIVAAAAMGWALRRTHRVEVRGDSMAPGFLPGDRLVVFRAGRPAPGQVVALIDPRDPDRVLVKRVAAAGPAGIDVRGDNTAHSTDSRRFGPVAATAIIGRVVYRYAPPARVGWLPGRVRPPGVTSNPGVPAPVWG